ncbi:uncharacterized protein [Rhodnius prolixus]|uniref:uncharacterized protein n=1 Tax=Rhodnius prolixus TaxID=13249 RepID=UPI003D18B61C
MKIHLNRQLVQDFFVSSSEILDSGGEIMVTLCAGQGGTPDDKIKRSWADSWQIVEMAARAGLILAKTRPFPHDLLSTYTSVGYRGQAKSFNTQNAIVHIFRVVPSLPMNMEETVNKSTSHLIDGVLMSYAHKKKVACNPYLNPSSPQSFAIKLLEASCRKLVSDYITMSARPFSRLPPCSNQTQCLVADNHRYLRNHLLYTCPNKDDNKHYLVKGLTFNEFSCDFAAAPVECHAAVFGPLSAEIIRNFMSEMKNQFHPYLYGDRKNHVYSLEANNWFVLQDEIQSGVDVNIDQLLASILDISWRQLWCPWTKILKDKCHSQLIPPSIHFQTFIFDATFRINCGSLDINKLLLLVQELNCDIIESVNLLSEYHPENGEPTYCFRFVYKSYYWALCRKMAVNYHKLITKAIEQLLNLQIV